MGKHRVKQIKVVREGLGGSPEYLLWSERVRRVLGETETPLLDLYETDAEIILEVDLPGVDVVKEVVLRAVHNQITIEGCRREGNSEAQAGGIRYLRMERSLEEFKRIVPIPTPVDPRRARADYRNGILTVVLPKIQDRREREVKIDIIR